MSHEVPKPPMPRSASELTPTKRAMLVQGLRKSLDIAVEIGRYRTIGGEDTAMRCALNGLAEGMLLEFFEGRRMVDWPEMKSGNAVRDADDPGPLVQDVTDAMLLEQRTGALEEIAALLLLCPLPEEDAGMRAIRRIVRESSVGDRQPSPLKKGQFLEYDAHPGAGD